FAHTRFQIFSIRNRDFRWHGQKIIYLRAKRKGRLCQTLLVRGGTRPPRALTKSAAMPQELKLHLRRELPSSSEISIHLDVEQALGVASASVPTCVQER